MLRVVIDRDNRSAESDSSAEHQQSPPSSPVLGCRSCRRICFTRECVPLLKERLALRLETCSACPWSCSAAASERGALAEHGGEAESGHDRHYAIMVPRSGRPVSPERDKERRVVILPKALDSDVVVPSDIFSKSSRYRRSGPLHPDPGRMWRVPRYHSRRQWNRFIRRFCYHAGTILAF
jgi:hypothetical protein